MTSVENDLQDTTIVLNTTQLFAGSVQNAGVKPTREIKDSKSNPKMCMKDMHVIGMKHVLVAIKS